MKLKNIFFAVLFAAVALSACDQIATPIIPKQINSVLPTTPPAFINSSDSTGANNYKQYKMLLEACGGHLCTNCPLGETDAENVLKSSIGGQVIFLQDEMGPLADTATFAAYPDSAFRKVDQCSADSIWYHTFFPNQFPWGLVNRESNWAFTLYLNYQDSCNTIVGRAATAGGPAVTIDIHDSCWTNPRIIGATFKVNILKPLTGSYSLETVIMEDSIYDWQDDNNVYEPYWHRNILRGAFGNNTGGNAWGVTITPLTAGGTFASFQTYDFTNGENGKAKGWNMAHCYIVAFVFNETTNEVVQAEMIKVE